MTVKWRNFVAFSLSFSLSFLFFNDVVFLKDTLKRAQTRRSCRRTTGRSYVAKGLSAHARDSSKIHFYPRKGRGLRLMDLGLEDPVVTPFLNEIPRSDARRELDAALAAPLSPTSCVS